MLKNLKNQIIENYVSERIILFNNKIKIQTTDLIFINYLSKEKEEINNLTIVENYENVLNDFSHYYNIELQLILLEKRSILFALIDPLLFLKKFNNISSYFSIELKTFLDEQLDQANFWLDQIHQQNYPQYWEKVN